MDDHGSEDDQDAKRVVKFFWDNPSLYDRGHVKGATKARFFVRKWSR